MLEGKTKSGFKYSIDERRLRDYRVVKSISDIDSEDATTQIKGMIELSSWLMGDDMGRLEEHVRKKNDGFADVQTIYAEIFEIINSQNKLKN